MINKTIETFYRGRYEDAFDANLDICFEQKKISAEVCRVMGAAGRIVQLEQNGQGPSDPARPLTKLVALAKLSKKSSSTIEHEMLFERAVWIYRLGCEGQAGNLLAYYVQTNDTKGDPHLKAEACYLLVQLHLRRFERSKAIDLLKRALCFNPGHQNAENLLKTLSDASHPLLSTGMEPICPRWGRTRGTPLDRYYIESFLYTNKHTIKGKVLEIQDNTYTLRFGGFDVNQSEVLDIDPSNPKVTITQDLTDISALPESAYDCIILTQTLHVISDIEMVLKGVAKMLQSGGTVLATLPSMSRIDPGAGIRHDHWRFTDASARFVFKKQFENVAVTGFGNVLSGAAFWYGLSFEDLNREQLDHYDSFFPVLFGVKATSPKKVQTHPSVIKKS